MGAYNHELRGGGVADYILFDGAVQGRNQIHAVVLTVVSRVRLTDVLE